MESKISCEDRSYDAVYAYQGLRSAQSGHRSFCPDDAGLGQPEANINARTTSSGRRQTTNWQKRQPVKPIGHRSMLEPTLMKHLLFAVAFLGLIVVAGCGAGHANLTSVTVSPQSATTTSSPEGQVGYTATGNFANGKSRELSQVDGLSWKTSQTSTGTVAATIGSTGEVTCSAPGTVTITASAPQNLSFTLNNGVHNTSMTVSGSATLTCE